MPKKKLREKRPFSLPEEYTFLHPILDDFQAHEAALSATAFLNLPYERQHYYFGVKQKLIELPVESALKLSKLYKKYPLKKYSETQKIHLFFSQLAQWQEGPILDQLPAGLAYLKNPALRFDLWSDDDKSHFLQESRTDEDRGLLQKLGVKFFEKGHEPIANQFLDQFPPHFFHQSLLFKNLLTIIRDEFNRSS